MRKARRVGARGCRESSESPADEWINNEVMGCEFQDVRHGKRMRQLLEQFAGKVGATTPWACQDWANMPARESAMKNRRKVIPTTNPADWSWNPHPACLPTARSASRRPTMTQNEQTMPIA